MFKVWLLALTFVFPVLDFELMAAESGPSTITEGDKDQQIMLAQKRKRRKNRRKKRKKSSSADGDLGSGKTLHAEHEGKDAPYAWDVGLLSDFRIVNSQTGDADPVGQGEYFLNGRALYIIGGSFEVGGDLEYSEVTVKTEDNETKNSSYVLTILAGYNFGSIDEDKMVFFARGGFGFGSSTVDLGDDSTSNSITRLTLAGGLHYFVDSNVALTTEIAYDADTVKPEEGDPTDVTTIHIARIGFSLFI